MPNLVETRRAKFRAQGGLCHYCGLPMWEGGSPAPTGCPPGLQCTAEHLLPRSEGGTSAPDNIVAACLHCNRTRHRAKVPRAPAAFKRRVAARMARGRWHGPDARRWGALRRP
ncbi:HNH endonuclease [Jannaschia sp. Os4]|nr:HNH endonuclease [Jannaschia sp. Os4]